MTPADLIAILREDYIDDISDVEDPDRLEFSDGVAFSTSYLLREIGTAQRQACYRQDLRHIFDEDTAEICTVPIVANQQSYTLDSRILRLHQVRLDDDVLTHITQAWLDSTGFNWRQASGTPRQFFVTGRKLTLDNPPTTGNLNLSVWREPLAAPQIHEELEWTAEPEQLCYWVASRAHQRPNTNIYDIKRAAEYRAMFDNAFGPEVSAQVRAELLAYPALNFGPAASSGCIRQSFDIFMG
jgi:hypothetical protein